MSDAESVQTIYAEAGLEVLNTLIQRTLVSQNFRVGMDVTEEEVERAMSNVAESKRLPAANFTAGWVFRFEWEAARRFVSPLRQMKFNQLILRLVLLSMSR